MTTKPIEGRDLKKVAVAMDENWRSIYGLAELIEERHIRDGVKGQFIEPVVERLVPASLEFDSDWKEKIWMRCSATIMCMVRVCSEKVGKDIILRECVGLNLPV